MEAKRNNDQTIVNTSAFKDIEAKAFSYFFRNHLLTMLS